MFIKKEKLENITKYGIKLSENANKSISVKNIEKTGFIAYLSPQDAKYYEDKNYICLRIKTHNISAVIYNKLCENEEYFKDFVCNISEYTYGQYEEPIALVCSSILPENIYIYNSSRDVPLIINNSKEYYYEKAIYSMLDDNKITVFEIYQILLILSEQKKLLSITNIGENSKIYTDKNTKTKYTKKINFKDVP